MLYTVRHESTPWGLVIHICADVTPTCSCTNLEKRAQLHACVCAYRKMYTAASLECERHELSCLPICSLTEKYENYCVLKTSVLFYLFSLVSIFLYGLLWHLLFIYMYLYMCRTITVQLVILNTIYIFIFLYKLYIFIFCV